MAIMLYSPQLSGRLEYLAQHLFEELWGDSVWLTADREEYKNGQGIAINYSTEAIRPQEVRLYPHDLLFQRGVQEQDISTGMHQGVPTCFAVPPGYALPFDPLAASFFMLSRYEEYLPFAADAHGRYPANLSWAHRSGALSRPIIWEWLKCLAEAIHECYPDWRPQRLPGDYQFLPTYDIDIPWAYRHRGWRGWGRALIEALRLDVTAWRERLAVWRDHTKDPFYTFPALAELHKNSGRRPRVFWLVANRAQYDVNTDPALPAFRRLVKEVSHWSDYGLHPSYQGGQNAARIQEEKDRLEQMANGQTIVRSRQHYLRLSLPLTYRELIAAGVREDYSMGFAAQIGFRAGTSEPFWWYDLEREQVTELRVYPFAVMDVSLKQYLGLDAAAGAKMLEELQAYCQQEGLTLCTLWHNSSFSERHGWNGWKEVYWSLFNTKPNES